MNDVLITIITKDVVKPECLASVHAQGVDWIICGKHARHSHPSPIIQTYLNCAENRESARRMALGHPAKWVLFLDSDIVLPADAVANFMKQTSVPNSSKRIIGGWYKMRNSKRWVCGLWVADNIFSHYNAPEPSLVRTDLIGLGCAFMSREAAKLLHFEHGTERIAKDITGNDMLLGECAVFSNVAQELEFEMFMDGSVICEHLQ